MAHSAYRLAELRRGLRPFRLHWFSRLRSTNDYAAVLRKRDELFAPAVVLTSCQTAGRGRGANRWWSPPGCLTATFILPVEQHLSPHQVPLVSGLAVRNAASQMAGSDDIALKWPNDIVHNGRKLAGLLCERIDNAELIGVGLNVNVEPSAAPRTLRRKITSLSQIAGRSLDMTAVLLCVARHLRRLFEKRREYPFPALLADYDAHHDLVGRVVCAAAPDGSSELHGVCEGIDGLGRLSIRTPKGLRFIHTGHVELAQ